MSRHPSCASSFGAALALGLVACAGAAPTPPPTARVAITVAPLALSEIEDVAYRVTVKNAANQIVWTEELRSSRFGDGDGSLSYVGSCDASSNDNKVELEILGVWGPGATPLDFVNPTVLAPLTKVVTCQPNADAPVAFAITLMRPAHQGFFDIGVTFDDIYCSAKLDCTKSDGTDSLLLFDPDTGARVPSAVFAVACTAGPGADTELYFDPLVLDCGSAGLVSVPIDGPEAGNVFTTNPPGPLRQVSTFRGVEALTQGAPAQSLSKIFFNSALALDPLPIGASCSLTGAVTAHDGALTDLTSPPGAYPIIAIHVPVLADSAGLACGLNPLDDPRAPVGTGVSSGYTPFETPHVFTFGARRAATTLVVFHADTPPAPVGTPASLTAVAGHGTITLAWSAVTSATGYLIERASSVGGPFVVISTLDASTLGLVDGGLAPELTRFYRVKAVRGATVGAPTSPVAGTTLTSIAVAQDGASVAVGSTITLVVTGGLPPYGFVLAQGEGAVSDDGVLSAGGFVGQAHVTVTDAAGGSVDALVTITIGTPTGLVATGVDDAIELEWDVVPGATGYRVERAESDAGPFVIVATDLTATTWRDEGLAALETWHYRVSALDAGGTGGAPTATVAGTTPSACGATNPCANGGTCHDVPGGFECDCPDGYGGALCDEDIDDCVGDPCGPGTCTDQIAGYGCACDPYHAFDGTTCVNIDYCDPSPCLNGGICTLIYDNGAGGGGGPGGGGNPDNPECLGAQCGRPKEVAIGFACACPPTHGGLTCQALSLGVTPSVARVFIATPTPLAVSGGIAPYTFIVASGPGTVSNTGVFTSASEGETVVAVSDASGQSATATLTAVRTCGPSSSWSTVLEPSAGYTNYNQLAPIRTQITSDSQGSVYLPASVEEADGGRAWVVVRRDPDTGTWTELDRHRRAIAVPINAMAIDLSASEWLVAGTLEAGAKTGPLHTMRRSADSGDTWSTAAVSPAPDFFSGQVVDLVRHGANVYAIGPGYKTPGGSGGAGLFYRSTDAGQSWTEVHRYFEPTSPQTYYFGAFRDGNGRLVAVGEAWHDADARYKAFFRTSIDGGDAWSTESYFTAPGAFGCRTATLASDDIVVCIGVIGNATRATVWRKDLGSAGSALVLDDRSVDWFLQGVVTFGGQVYVIGSHAPAGQQQKWVVLKGPLDGSAAFTIVDAWAPQGANAFGFGRGLRVTPSGRLVAVGQGYDGSTMRLVLRTSTDAGANWTGLVLDDRPDGIGGGQYLLETIGETAVVSTGSRLYRVDLTTGVVSVGGNGSSARPSGNNAARAIVVDEAAGAIYATGIGGKTLGADGTTTYVGLTRADLGDGLGWRTVDDHDPSSMGTSLLDILQVAQGDAAGRLLTWGFIGDAVGMSFAPFLRVSDDDGQTWSTQDTSDFERRASALAQGPDGTIYSAGADQSGMRCHWIIRASADGGDTWTELDAFASTGMFCMNDRDHQPFDMAVDGQGRLWAVGVANNNFMPEWAVRRRDVDGTWTTVEQLPRSGGEDGALSIAIDARDNVYVGGYGQIRTSTDGGASWVQLEDGVKFIGLTTDPSGNVFAAEADGGSQGGALTVHAYHCVP